MTKVRFAPSPTGIPHVGNIRTALFDYFLAKADHGTFILRLEDTDQARKVEGAEEAIKESLTWLGAMWDDFVVQSDRLDDYKRYADELVAKGVAREEDGAIRFIVDKSIGQIAWNDAIGNKEVIYEAENIEDFIILKADGYPTYHLANVVDDHAMEITHVIRGEDWIPSTPKHILLYQAFGWAQPVFAHVPNVLGTDGKKLSKRRGAKSVLNFKEEGYLPEALRNYLMLLGWSPKDDREILSEDEIIQDFSLENINASPAVFDERKLQWLNGEYIRKCTYEELLEKLKQYDHEFVGKLDNLNLLGLITVAQTRVKTLAEFRPSIEQMLVGKVDPSSEGVELRQQIRDVLSKIDEWNKQTILDQIMGKFIQAGVKFPAIYKAIYGVDRGLPIADTFELLGKDKTLELLN